MSWRDGCLPRPAVHPGAAPVAFDFGAADALGPRLDALAGAIDASLATRARAQDHLHDWAGAHRTAYDAHRRTHEATLAGDGVATQLARLRAAWDEAAAAQGRANRAVAESRPERPAVAPPPGPPGVR